MGHKMTKRFLVFSTVLLIATNNSLAAEISEQLHCAVQSFTSISVQTNKTDSVSVEKYDSKKPINVIYEPLSNGKQVLEKYGADSDIEKISLFNKGYSAGGTQYLGQDNPDHAITYFGLNDDGYHVVVKYIRMPRNDGGEKRGWRTDNYFNTFMYCVDDKKMKPANK